MRLLFSSTSPYARKVRVLLREKGLAAQVTEVVVNPMEPNADLAALNPLHKVPALVRDSASALYDSPVICEYLDALNDTPRLVPAQGEARWRVLRLQALADGILDAAFATVMEGRRPESERSAQWLDRWRQAIDRGVAALDEERAALEGPLDLGPIAAAAALDYLAFRLPEITWRDAHPGLAAWFDAFAARPSMRDTDPRA